MAAKACGKRIQPCSTDNHKTPTRGKIIQWHQQPEVDKRGNNGHITTKRNELCLVKKGKELR